MRMKSVLACVLMSSIFLSTAALLNNATRNPSYPSEGSSIAALASSVKRKAKLSWAKVRKGAVPVLMYHAVDDNIFGEKDLFVSTKAFAEQMKYLHDNGYTTIDFSEIRSYRKYKKPIVITFDDGYEDNYTNAYPILKKYAFKATVFIVSGFIGKNNYLNAEQVRQMTDVVSFQSHTVNHIMLSKADRLTVETECAESKRQIEKLTGKPVFAIAYPFGEYNNDTVAVARKYYSCGFNTKFGYYWAWSGVYDIRRITVGCSDTLKDFAGKI